MTAGLQIVRTGDVEPRDGVVAPSCEGRGDVRTWEVSPPGHPLWLVVTHLAEGAEVSWSGPHGDEAVHVVRGALDLDDGRSCPTGGAVVVESGAACTVRASRPTQVVHVGPTDPDPPGDGAYGPPRAEGHGVHVRGERGLWSAVGGVRDSCLYADSACPTCRITLLRTSRLGPYRAASHTHSQDELIHVLWGELQVGRERAGPGTTLAIAADHRYGFTSGPGGYAFLNYRRDISTCVTDPKVEGLLETGPMMGMEPVGGHR